MPTSYSLGNHYEGLVKSLLKTGRYNNASEVLRDGLRLVEAREARLAALDQALERGLADEAAGRLTPMEDVTAQLREKYTRMAAERREV